MDWKIITLNNGNKVQAFYQSELEETQNDPDINFEFKKLNDGTIARQIIFVDIDGNKITI